MEYCTLEVQKIMKNAEMMVKLLDYFKHQMTDLFEGNVVECGSYMFDKNDPRYFGSHMYLFPVKKSVTFDHEIIQGEIHYRYTPEDLSGEIHFDIFMGIYDMKLGKMIYILDIGDGCIDQYDMVDDAIKERALEKFVKDIEGFILDL